MSEVTLEAIENLLDAKLDEKLDQAVSGLATKDDLITETRPLKTQLNSIEAKVDRISSRSSEDAVATMKDVEKLKGRVKTLEEEVKNLKVHPA